MNNREELLKALNEAENKVRDKSLARPLTLDEWLDIYADHLIFKGWTKPPCNPGDNAWFIRNLGRRGYETLIETTVEKIVIKSSGMYLKLACNAMYETSCNSIGKTVFFDKAKAEEKLGGYNGN